MTDHERTEWRDLEMSKRHRRWGHNCPITDIDFLVVEYDRCQPVALVEYKHENAAKFTRNDPNYRTLINLGRVADLPTFSVRYAGNFSWWIVTPLNQQAKRKLGKQDKMTEKQYVSFLYRLRDRELPVFLFNDEKLRGEQ